MKLMKSMKLKKKHIQLLCITLLVIIIIILMQSVQYWLYKYEKCDKCNEGFKNKSGPCITKNGKWGVSLPKYGNKCVIPSDVKHDIELIKNMDDYNDENENNINDDNEGYQNKNKNKNKYKLKYIPNINDTECYPIKSKDEIDLDRICQETKGVDYGVGAIIRNGCKKGMKRARCAKGYFNNHKYNPNISTDCFLDNTVNFDKKCEYYFGKNVGMKEIDNKSCPNGKSRAVCAMNYKNGKKRFTYLTECRKIGEDFDQICKTKFKNNKYYAQKTMKDDCPIGEEKAKCRYKY